MRITFETVDDEFYGVKEYIMPVIEQCIKNEVFVKILCEILFTFDTFKGSISNDVKKALELEGKVNMYNMDDITKANYKLFSDSLYNFYWNVVDDEFGEEIRKRNEKHYYDKRLRYPDSRLGRYRGLLFEEVVCAMVKGRYEKELFGKGCIIRVNGVKIFARYGEFYECKIKPIRFEAENYKLFMQIKNVLDKDEHNRYILALVSPDTREHLMARKRFIENTNPECNIEFEVLGREDLFKLLALNLAGF
jgi:hypothetical protein